MKHLKNFNQLNEGVSTRKISDIAAEIYADWKPVHPYAEQYLEAMTSLDTLDDKYGQDDGSGIVAYFLSNATTWKGEKARAIKKELKDMLNAYYKKK
jgi:hypothetical protein